MKWKFYAQGLDSILMLQYKVGNLYMLFCILNQSFSPKNNVTGRVPGEEVRGHLVYSRNSVTSDHYSGLEE